MTKIQELTLVILSLVFAVQLVCRRVQAQGPSVCQSLQPSPALEKFLDKLPTAPSIDVTTGKQVVIGVYKFTQKLHRDLPPTTLYGYGCSQATATFPGPTLIAEQNTPAYVRWENHLLDEEHFLTVDRTLHWADPKHGGVPIVVHLHGGEVDSISDGYPDAWHTARGDYGYAYTTKNYTYANSQRPTMLWYHDHVVGITRLNVYGGMTGLYIIRAPEIEEKFNLPEGKFEIHMVVQDRQFFPNGSLNFPNVGNAPEVHPNWCPEMFGDTILVNGKVWPHLKVLPRLYRFRILNAANARFFNLTLSNPHLTFFQIGTDGGYVFKPMNRSALILAPAERVDVLVDFSGLAPQTVFYMNNSGAAPFPYAQASNSPPGTESVMKFQVTGKKVDRNQRGNDIHKIPATFLSEPPVNITAVKIIRNLTLVEFDTPAGEPYLMLQSNLTWRDEVTELPKIGSIEIWEMINLNADAHPMHVHLIQFFALSTQSFNLTSVLDMSCSLDIPYGQDGSCYIERPKPPFDYQRGWKDTVIAHPGNVTRLWVRFQPQAGGAFPFDPSQGPGYVWHCHMVDHEDNDMMRPFKVLM